MQPDSALPIRKAGVIVAHPDDETLWAGGLLIEHAGWDWFIGSLCRASDPDRAPRFSRVTAALGAVGAMGDMDDGPDQRPLSALEVQQQVLRLLPQTHFDVLLTHGPRGEYTWHQRHVDVWQAVAELWRTQQISAGALWLFAYEDGGRTYFPRAVVDAHVHKVLAASFWQTKYDLITQVYGFRPESWEAQTTPREEAFWCFETPESLNAWLGQRGLTA